VGTQAGAESDTAFWNQAKAAAKPGTSFSEIAQRAQALKAQAQQRQPSPLGAVPLFSRPLVAPPEPSTQLDLGMNLPRRGEAFYSKAEQVADAKLPKSGPGDSFLATLRNNGVKAEEIADLKLDDFAGKAKVTKEEFLNAIRSRRPQLEQTALQGGDTSYEDYSTPGGRNYRETLTQYPQSEAAQRANALKDEIATRKAELDDEIDRHNNASAKDQAQWPDDYFDKERAAISQLQVQLRSVEAQSRGTEFTSGHWVEHPNVLAHSRESDFMTSDGMPVRHVHEWQSDLHQRGRERGYQVPPIRTLPEGFHTAKTAHGYSIVNREGVAVSGGLAPTQEDAINDFISIHNSQNANTTGVPNAPFKKSWHELAVKDSIRRAVKDGMHGMTWDTGETQANRYDLAKQVERVQYDPHTETLTAHDHSGSKVIDENVKPEDIENYVGKEAAQKLHDQIENYGKGPSRDDYDIRENEDGTYDVVDQNGEVLGNEPFTSHYGATREIRALVEHDRDTEPLPTLRGLDLQVGGEGMSGFYDKMIPDFVRKYTKKWGAKVDTAEIPTGESKTQHEYVGPDRTEAEVRQAWEQAAHRGPREWKQTKGGSWAWFESDRQVSGAFPENSDRATAAHTISNDPTERELRYLLEEVHRGVPFKQAVSAVPDDIAQLFGGKITATQTPRTTTVHRLNFTPEMISAIKSEGQPLYARNLQPGEDAMEAARRGAGGEAPPPSPAQRAQTNVDRLKAQLEQQRAAGDSAQYHTVSQLRNAEDELASAQQAQRPALMAQHPPGNVVREILRSARDMEPRVDPGGPDRAARIMLDSSAHNLLQTLMPDQGQWLGISHHEDAGRQIANALRETADNWEKGRFGVDPQAIDNMRTLARQIDRVRDLNSDPNAPGHAGIPFVYDPKASFHEGETHGGQRALSPTGSPLDFTNVPKTEAHPTVEAARPVLQKINADTPGLRTAELHAHLLDGNYKALGLTPEQAVSFIQHSLDVLEEHHGERVKGDIPRLAKRYIQAMRDFVATGGESATRGTAAATAETPHGPGAGEDHGDNVPAREAPESGAGRGGGTPGPSEGLKQEPLFSRRLTPADKEAEALRVSPRNPSGPKAVGANDPLTNNLPADGEAIRAARNNRGESIAANIAARMRYYPGPRFESGRTDDVLSAIHKHAVSNLQWVHDNFPAQWREPSKLWYPTGNKLVHAWSHEYSIAPEQASSVIATQSPQKDWHMNRSLAQRIIEMYKQQNELRWSTGMRDKGREWLETAANNKKATPENVRKNVERLRGILNSVASKRYSDLETPTQKAAWMRLWDETNNNPSYDIFAPDGSNIGPARNTDKDQTLSSVAWGGYKGIAKAISILEDGSRENISRQLGDAHKIRSFDNNIIAPNSLSGDVTIDTHAVAAALLRALSGKSKEVKHNFGSKGLTSTANGVMGAYGLYGDAYREVAKNNGLLPLIEQSVTWEGIRSLFPAEYKTKANNAIIDQFWKEYANGDKTLGQTRRAIVQAAGGFKPPEWAEKFLGRSRSSPSRNEPPRAAARPRDVPGAELPGQPTGGAGRGGRGGPAGAVPVGRRGVASSPIPPQLKRFMKR
jgi:hypothetical protein